MDEQTTLLIAIVVAIAVISVDLILRRRIASFFVKVGPVQAGASTHKSHSHTIKNVEQVATVGDNDAQIEGNAVEIDGLSQKSAQKNVLRVGKPRLDD